MEYLIAVRAMLPQGGGGLWSRAMHDICRTTQDPHIPVRLILIGELFSKISKVLELIGDMYRYTEAFCHYL